MRPGIGRLLGVIVLATLAAAGCAVGVPSRAPAPTPGVDSFSGFPTHLGR